MRSGNSERLGGVSRALILATSALVLPLSVMAGISPSTAHAADKFDHRPIVFVHGHAAGPGAWDSLKSDARALGYKSEELLAFDYSQTSGDTGIESVAKDLGKYISDNSLTSRSPDGKIDIVAHSMGGLVARYYLKNDGGTSTTKHLVTLGTPNHGTLAADAACATGIKCDGQTKQMTTTSSFLKDLNSGSETPGPTQYATFRANVGDEPAIAGSGTGYCDGVVFGGTTSALSGAAQNVVTGCIAHNDYPSNPWTKQKTLAVISDPDGAHTPQAAQFDCAPLQENWGKDKWVSAHTSSCMTVTGTSTQQRAYSELLVRGCGYYYGVGVWYYAGYKDVTCDVTYDGQGTKSATFHNKGMKSEKIRTMEIGSDSFPVSKGQTLGATWSFGIHSYQSAEWDAHGGAQSPELTVK